MREHQHAVRCIMLVTLGVVGLGWFCLSMAQTAGPATPSAVWNKFTERSMPPAAEKVESHKAASAPATERGTCVRRLQRVVNAKFLPTGIDARLIPLRDWTLPIGNVPAGKQPSGNCFLVRQEHNNDIVQVEEGLGFVVVEIRRVDGSRLVAEGADLADYAATAAREWLAPSMQPRDEVHRLTERVPAVATWLTKDVAETTDPTKLTFEICRAYSDGLYLRYEILAYQKTAKRAFQPPAPYAFEPAPNP